MRPSRILIALTTFVGTLLVSAAPALAEANGGEGWFGETTDKSVTIVMFATIAFFPLAALLFSLIQSWLDKRHHAREDAERARATNPDWHGGW